MVQRLPIPTNIKDEQQVNAYFNELARRVGNTTSKDLLKATNYSDSTRPTTLTSNDSGIIIYNTDDGQLNIWNGSAWTLPDGSVT